MEENGIDRSGSGQKEMTGTRKDCEKIVKEVRQAALE